MSYGLSPSGHTADREERNHEDEIAARDAPVLVDDIKRDLEGFPMTRCVYFTVTYVTGEAPGDLVLPLAVPVSVAVTELSGVIVGDMRGRPFLDAGRIEELFETVEGRENWLIENPAVWLPNELVLDACPEAAYGSLLRVPLDLLAWAIAYSNGTLSDREYRVRMEAPLRPALRDSPEESKAFQEWSGSELEKVRKNYQERLGEKAGVLPWRRPDGALMLGNEPLEIG